MFNNWKRRALQAENDVVRLVRQQTDLERQITQLQNVCKELEISALKYQEVCRGQNKGLRRLSRKCKRLQAELNQRMPNLLSVEAE